MKKITIQDVAKELNLSRNTVAKALNNSDTVAYETRHLVAEKAFEMGYSKLLPIVLNEFKLENKSEKTKTILVLTRREISIFWNRIIMGISDELSKCSCKLRLNFVSEEEESGLILPIDLQAHTDGILILSVFSKVYVEQIIKQNIPIVFLDISSEIYDIPHIGDVIVSEGIRSTKILTESLVKQGLKKIGFIGDINYCKTIRDRYEGYIRALEDAGIPLDSSIIAVYHTRKNFYVPAEVEEAIDSFACIPEAIVCANDNIALDAIRYLKSRGLSVPEDIAVTGYDNVEGMMQVEPFLTTVRVGNQRLGRRLVQLLLWRISNPEFPQELISIGAEIIYRNSSQKQSDTKN